MLKIDHINIVTRELPNARPGQKRFSARVQALYVVDENGRRKVNRQFGDSWGHTRNEAVQRLETIVNAWLATQQGS